MYYEIEGTTARLAGSVHLLPATAPSLPVWVWSAYQWADTIIFEHDVSQAQQHVMLKDGDSLESHLPVDLWNKLVAAWPTDRPLAAISSLKPWMAIPTLSLSRFSAAPGVEVQLTGRARQDNKSVSHLETMAEFAELADAVPLATLHKALYSSLNRINCFLKLSVLEIAQLLDCGAVRSLRWRETVGVLPFTTRPVTSCRRIREIQEDHGDKETDLNLLLVQRTWMVWRHPRTAEISYAFSASKLTPKLTPNCKLL